AAWHDVRELERENVQDVALRMIELDLDRPVCVVRDVPRDVALLGRGIAVRAADAGDRREAADARRVHLERAPDRVPEVARVDRLAVGVMQVLAERELQGLS